MYFLKYRTINILMRYDGILGPMPCVKEKGHIFYLSSCLIDNLSQLKTYERKRIYAQHLGEEKLILVTFDDLNLIEHDHPNACHLFMSKQTLNNIKKVAYELVCGYVEKVVLEYVDISVNEYGIDVNFKWSSCSDEHCYKIKLDDDHDSNILENDMRLLPLIVPLYNEINQLKEIVQNLQMQILYMPPGGGEMYQKAKQEFEELGK